MIKITEEVAIIRIVQDGVGPIDASSASGSVGPSAGAGNAFSGVGKTFGNAMKGVLKGLGIATGIGLIVQIVSSFSALISIISNIFKIISMVLKPVADLLMVLLMPILMFLKPIVIVLNQVMQPFTRLAMQIMREGGKKLQEGDTGGAMAAFGGAATVMLSGISSVLLVITSEIQKTMITSLTTAMKMLVGIAIESLKVFVSLFSSLFPETSAKVIEGLDGIREDAFSGLDKMEGFLHTKINNARDTTITSMIAIAGEIGTQLGLSTSSFKQDALNRISGVLHTDPDSMLEGFREAFGKFATGAGNVMVNAFDDIMDDIEDKYDKQLKQITKERGYDPAFQRRSGDFFGGDTTWYKP